MHEYLEYIRDGGAIDEPLYEEMVANVINGECKHVKGTPKEFLKETGLYGIHFAAACGTIEALRKQCVQNLAYFSTKLFSANPWTIAVAKHNDLSLQIFIGTEQNAFFVAAVRMLMSVNLSGMEKFLIFETLYPWNNV